MAGDVRIPYVPMLFVFALVIGGKLCVSLNCWQCIADDCHENPQSNGRTSTKTCKDGESCQKVFYKVKAAKEELIYESTVRTCSVGRCEPRNDFVNCSKDMLENPGCMRRYCCSDKDLCNWAPTVRLDEPLLLVLLSVIVPLVLNHLTR